MDAGVGAFHAGVVAEGENDAGNDQQQGQSGRKAAQAPGVGPAQGWVRVVMMVLLALATVTAMRLAGVVLASALLILPGATALKMSVRSGAVMGLAMGAALAGVLLGLVVAFEVGWPPGPAIVVVLTAVFAGAEGWRRVGGRVNGSAT